MFAVNWKNVDTVNEKNWKKIGTSERAFLKHLHNFIYTHLVSVLMSGYFSDGALSISSTSDSISTKSRDQLWRDEEKSHRACKKALRRV